MDVPTINGEKIYGWKKKNTKKETATLSKKKRGTEKKQETLRVLLFRNYFLVILVLLLTLYVMTLFYYINEQVRQVLRQQSSLCTYVENSIDASVEKMSIVSMNVLYSKTIRNELEQADLEKLSIRKMERVYDAIASIIGPYGTVSQVDVHSVWNLAVGWGNYELCKKETYQEIPWYEEIKKCDGKKWIGKPEYRSDLAYYNRYLKNKKFLSLYRMFFDESYREEGIVEVIQNCDTFFAGLESLKKENPRCRVLVLNEQYEQIYPYDGEAETVSEKLQSNLPEQKGEIRNLHHQGSQIVSALRFGDCAWTVVVSQDRWQAFQPLVFVLGIYLLIGLLALGISVLVCYRISNTVTKPIYQLKENIERIDLEKIMNASAQQDASTEFLPVQARTAEVEMLSHVFQELYENLGTSTQNLLCAKKEEQRAKMTATQSMLKPHFIFNNLANISVMAEENMNEEITELCKNLCDYLRYIAADGMTTVDIKTEIFYTKKYLECIKVRYGKRLNWKFEIPPELEEVPISKLSLQPLVENAQKYAFRTKPPWEIIVRGKVENGMWELSVLDDGIGISEEYQREVYENLERIREHRDISMLKIGGMGLANVYLRLLLLHGDDAQLLIENQECGGVKVILRARLPEQKQQEREEL